MAMASYGNQACFLSLALFLAILTTAPYVAHGTVNVTLAGIRAYGNLLCPPTGVPLFGANVTLFCSNINASVLTNQNGFFNVTLIPPANVTLGFNLTRILALRNCIVSAFIGRGCPVVPVGGRLIGVPTAVGILVDQVGALLDAEVLAFNIIGPR